MNDIKNEPEVYYDEYEIDLKEYIYVLWDNKWLIIGLCVLAVFFAGIYSQYMMKPKYQAKSTLLILPPKYKTSLEVSTFPVETYKNLAMTQSMKSQIIEKLNLKHDDGQQYSPSDLDGMLKIEIQAQSQNDNGNLKVPLLILEVTGSDSELVSNIANTWADIFMNATKQIRKSEVTDIVGVIQNQFDNTKQKLLNTKQRLKDFNEKYRLELVKSELNIKKKHLSNYRDELLSFKSKLITERASFQQLQENISQLENNGKWIGAFGVDEPEGKSLLGKVKKNYREGQNSLLDFKRKHDILLLKQRISVTTGELEKYRNKLISLKSTLETKKVEVQKISSLLDKESDRWTIKRSISGDAFWEKILTPKEINILQNLSLEDEVINPIYRKLKSRLSDSEILVQSIPEQIKYYQSQVSRSESEVTNLNNRLDEWNQKLARLKSDLRHYKVLYGSQASTYEKLKDKLVQTELNIRSLNSQITFYKQKVNSLETDVKQLQSFIWGNEIKKQQIAQQVNDIQKTYNNLASKVEEARITEAQKTSDVKFIARSVPPTEPIGPNKKLNVAIAGVLALMIGIFIVFIKEMFKNE